jgi:hypothetical protein
MSTTHDLMLRAASSERAYWRGQQREEEVADDARFDFAQRWSENFEYRDISATRNGRGETHRTSLCIPAASLCRAAARRDQKSICALTFRNRACSTDVGVSQLPADVAVAGTNAWLYVNTGALLNML